MGYGAWSDDHYKAKTEHRERTAEPVFKHDEEVRTGKVAAAVHKDLCVKGVTLRESRDSEGHPRSRAVAVLLDVTGSMRNVPSMIQKNLPGLMGMLLRKGYLTDPHILVGAIGDAHGDKYPIQIGQFESGIEIDDQISNLLLEGGGGAGIQESYELAMYFMAKHTEMDCLKLRGEKGFLFIIGDEQFYSTVEKDQIEKYIGPVQAGMSTKDMMKELQAKYEVFFVMPKMTANYGEERILEPWREFLGQNILLLDDPNGICELIASTVAVSEGLELEKVGEDMTEAGVTKETATAVSKALVPYAKTASERPTALKVKGTGKPSGLVEV